MPCCASLKSRHPVNQRCDKGLSVAKRGACSFAISTLFLPFMVLVLLGSILVPSFTLSLTQARAASPITPSGLNTEINLSATPVAGAVQYDITGGTRPGGGVNLFHSFGDFNVPTNNIANFLNETALPTSNILGCVTSGNISSIFGTIQTTGFGNANLFLMNPTGFLFGPNAIVNVGGAVAFTSADYLRLVDGVHFNTLPTGSADALLSAAPVAAFGFLGSNPGAITVQGSQLSVTPGQAISLVGGNHTVQSSTLENSTVQSARLSAPGGQINLASIASSGEVSAVDFTPVSGMTMGSINLSQEATLDVSGNAAGTVRIRGGQLVIAEATISADTVNVNGASIALDIRLTDDLVISDTRGLPAMTATTSGDGNAGTIQINSANLGATSSFTASDRFALIDTHTSGAGTAGTINILTGNLHASSNLQASSPETSTVRFIDSGTVNSGHGGDVRISSQSVSLEGMGITTGPSLASDDLEASGSPGNVTINADRLMLLNSLIDTSVVLLGNSLPGRAGSITLNAQDILLRESNVNALGLAGSGAIVVNADTLIMDAGAQLDSRTASELGGGIFVNAKTVELRNGSTFATDTFGDGQAGDIHVNVLHHLTLSTSPLNSGPSGFFSGSIGGLGSTGSGIGGGGSVIVSTPRLDMTGGSQINTVTRTSGSGGNVLINATKSISISGEMSSVADPISGIATISPGGIFTQTLGGDFCLFCGVAGQISITTGSLAVSSGAQIDAGTTSASAGGNIAINARDSITISGTLSDGSAGGIFSRSIGTSPEAGSGGNIDLKAGQSVRLNNGSTISAESTGAGDAGDIFIDAGQNYTSTDSEVTTRAEQASGGNITVIATNMFQLINSKFSASVQGAKETVSGNITIDPPYVVLQHSQILAQATQGEGGDISITANLFLPDDFSLRNIRTDSDFGVNGTVTIQSPNSPASGKIQPLGNQPLEATSLLNQRCAAVTGGHFSSFTVAGRDILPAEQGNWLASPLTTLSAGTGRGAKVEGKRYVSRGEGLEGTTMRASLAGENTLLSLRQVAPAGFLTQAFAVDWSAGCQS